MKSTALNIIANKLNLKGQEYAACNMFGKPYFMQYVGECQYTLGDDEDGLVSRIPEGSRYIKSEDILYEIKKIQQEQILADGYVYEHIRRGMPKNQREALKNSYKMKKDLECLEFAQEKYSNGETTLQMLDDAKIYDMDSAELEEKSWTELANVRYFYEFFRKHKDAFEDSEW